MAGGYTAPQAPGDHQVVIFTLVGELTDQDVTEWNNAILRLKQMFGPKLVGVTLKGLPTSPELLRLQKQRPAPQQR